MTAPMAVKSTKTRDNQSGAQTTSVLKPRPTKIELPSTTDKLKMLEKKHQTEECGYQKIQS